MLWVVWCLMLQGCRLGGAPSGRGPLKYFPVLLQEEEVKS